MSSSSAMNFDAQSTAAAARQQAAADVTGAVMLAAGAVFALSVATADLLTYHVNLPIVYIVALLLAERAGSRRLLWQSAAVLVALTYAGYFFGKHPPGVDEWPDLGARFVNRTMAATTLIIGAAVLHTGIAMRERAGRGARHAWPHDPDGLSYQRAVLSIERVLAPALAGVLVAALFVSDAAAQAEYNIAVLYALPLVILARTRHPAIIWTGLPVLVAATLLGLFVGPPAEPQHLPNLA